VSEQSAACFARDWKQNWELEQGQANIIQ